MDNPIRGACALCIVQTTRGEIMMVRAQPSDKPPPIFWKLPAGKLKPTDESIRHAAQRELLQETGNYVDIAEIKHIHTIDKGSYDIVIHAIGLDNPILQPVDTREIASVKLFSISEIMEKSYEFLPPHLGYLRQLRYL